MTGDNYGGDTGGVDFAPINLGGLANSAVQAFGIYEAGQTAQKAAKHLSSSGTMYVILGLGGLALIGLLIFKH